MAKNGTISITSAAFIFRVCIILLDSFSFFGPVFCAIHMVYEKMRWICTHFRFQPMHFGKLYNTMNLPSKWQRKKKPSAASILLEYAALFQSKNLQTVEKFYWNCITSQWMKHGSSYSTLCFSAHQSLLSDTQQQFPGSAGRMRWWNVSSTNNFTIMS